jgi:transcriptional regulator
VYLPPAFREDQPEPLYQLIREHSFGVLISQVDGAPFATHLPFLLRGEHEGRAVLVGHMARANPHWKSWAPETEVLVIFQGPHTYVSPSWYETELSVPTWNYAAVHAYGCPRLLEDPASLRAVLEATTSTYEAGMAVPWSVDRLPDEFVGNLSRAIVGFEIEITRLEGKLKLSQNRSEADRQGVIAALQAAGAPDGLAVAAMMTDRSVPPR